MKLMIQVTKQQGHKIIDEDIILFMHSDPEYFENKPHFDYVC